MLVAARSVSPRTVEEREKAMAASAAESHRTARRALPLTRGRAGSPPLLRVGAGGRGVGCGGARAFAPSWTRGPQETQPPIRGPWPPDRKSTRLNSSHLGISYAVFCL